MSDLTKDWSMDDYADAKSMLGHPDVPANKRAKLEAAVKDYEADDAAYRAVSYDTPAPPAPKFDEPAPAQSQTKTGVVATGNYEKSPSLLAHHVVPEGSTPMAGASAGRRGVAHALAARPSSLLPQGDWMARPRQILRNASEATADFNEDESKMFWNALAFGHMDDAIEALGDPADAARFRQEVEHAQKRSPVGSFVGSALPVLIGGVGGAAAKAAPAAKTVAQEAVPLTQRIIAAAPKVAKRVGRGAGIGAALGGVSAHGESERHGLETLPDVGYGALTGGLVGLGAEAVPGVVNAGARGLKKLGTGAKEYADRALAFALGAPADKVYKLTKGERGKQILADLADTWRRQGLNDWKGKIIPPSAADIAERAATVQEAEHQVGDAVRDAVGDQALIDPLEARAAIRTLKRDYAAGGFTGQPIRDKIDEMADSWLRMKQVKGEPLTYHATPVENIPEVQARGGLDPGEGGKNYKLKKNAGRSYFGRDTPDKPIHESMQKWAPDVAATAPYPSEGSALLRTAAPVEDIAGTHPSVVERTTATPSEALEYLDPATETWQPMSQLGKPPALEPDVPGVPKWFEEGHDPWEGFALPENATPANRFALPENAGASSLGEARPQVSARADVFPPSDPDAALAALGQEAETEAAQRALPGGSPLGEPRPQVSARADVFPPHDPNARIGPVIDAAEGGEAAALPGGRPQVEAQAEVLPRTPHAMPGSRAALPPDIRVTPDILTADVVTPTRRGIPIGEAIKEKSALGKRAYGSDSPEAMLKRQVYGKINQQIGRAADRVMPGSGAKLRQSGWNESAAITAENWARKKALQEQARSNTVSWGDALTGATGSVVSALLSGNPLTGFGVGVGARRLIRGRGHSVLEKIASGIAGGGTRGEGVAALGQALESWRGRAPLVAPVASAKAGPLTAAFARDRSQRGAEQKEASDEGRGHLTADAARDLLAQNPRALGQWSDAWRQALDSGDSTKISALMERLDKQPMYVGHVKKLLQDRTAKR